MSDLLTKAQKKQQELFEQIFSSSEILLQRPLFHFATPGGWCNDPNGFSQFNGKIHLFYQYHPYSTKWGPMHWGHVTSTDFLNWQLELVALAPDSPYDEKGCFSGTALEHNGHHLLIYTGVSSNGNQDIQKQCLAAGDGKTYHKIPENPVISAENIPFEYKITDFRDPKIWKKDDFFYLLCVLKQNNNRGAMVLFQSADAIHWTYKGIPDFSKDGLSGMWECPDFSVIDGNDVLIFSPQEMKEDYELGFHSGNNSVYITGTLDYESGKFKRENRSENNYTAALVDYGIDFYAPETTKLSDGRTIMIGWMQAWESCITPENYLWSGMMTLPRELSIKENRLFQKPVRELENWKKEHKTAVISSGSESEIFSNGKRHFEIDLELKPEAKGVLEVILGHKSQEVVLKINYDENYLYFDRSRTNTPGKVSCRKVKLRTINRPVSVKLICDTCSMEAFLDDGIMTFTNTFFFTGEKSSLTIRNLTSVKINCNFWKLQKQT